MSITLVKILKRDGTNPTHHVDDPDGSEGEDDGVGRGGDGQHEGEGRCDGRGEHEEQRVQVQR